MGVGRLGMIGMVNLKMCMKKTFLLLMRLRE